MYYRTNYGFSKPSNNEFFVFEDNIYRNIKYRTNTIHDELYTQL